jgi:hypothetical protein
MSPPPVETVVITQPKSRHGPPMKTTVSVSKARNEDGIPGEIISVSRSIDVITPPPESLNEEGEASEKLKAERAEAKRIVRYDDVYVALESLKLSLIY